MRAIIFSINPFELKWLNKDKCPVEDFDEIMDIASNNHVEVINNFIFEGDRKNLFSFLVDVSIRYDIELI